MLVYLSTGKQLGKGGYSVVYEAINKQTKIRYAVKEVMRSSMKPVDEEALRLEMEIMGELNHPHIVKFIDVFEDKDNFYIVLGEEQPQ